MRRLCLPIALTAAVLLAGCGDQSQPGDLITSNDDITGTTATVEVPSGTLAVTVGKPMDDAPEEDVGGQPTSVDGGRYVGVSWDFDQRSGGNAAVTIPLVGHVKPIAISLVADGRRYRVGSPYNVVLDGRGIQEAGNARQYVAVKGDAENLRLEVAYDGLTQQVEFPSGKVRATQATALADLQPRARQTCTPVGRMDLQGLTKVPVDCHVNTAVRLPYVAGLGWAEPGHEWAVVDIATGVGPTPPEWKRPGRPGSVRYVPYGLPASEFTVDGQKERSTILDRDQPNDDRYTLRMLAFDVPAGRPATLRIFQEFVLLGDNILDADFDQAPHEATVDIVREAEI